MRLARWAIHIGVTALLLGAPTGSIKADDSPDALKHGFANPPPAAWPRTWWHWTRGAVTKEGITKDLEWMQRIGIAGFQLADVSFGGGQTVEPPMVYGSADWQDALRHAANEAKRLGLEMTVFSSPGWSITGGPWVEPHQAMKKLVWSEIEVEGPREFRERLPQPPANEGAFQDMGASRGGGADFYRDVRVLAFRNAIDEVSEQAPEVASQVGPIDGTLLTDGSYDKAITIDAPENGSPAWVEYTFAEPTTVQAVTIAGGAGIPLGRIAASDDGKTYRTLVALPGAQLYRQGRVRTFAFRKSGRGTSEWKCQAGRSVRLLL